MEFGVEKIRLVGFDFEDPYLNPTKKKKLKRIKKLREISDF